MNDKELLGLIKNEYYRINPKGCWDFFKKRDKRIPCLPTLQKRFNKTYNEILIMVGIPEEELNFVRRTPREYLEKLRNISLELGYIPSANEFRERGYTPETLVRYFGSYSNAVKKLNFDVQTHKTPIKVKETNEELLEMYIDFSNKIGRPASYTDLVENDEIYHADVFTIRFGGMMGLKEAAGFPIIDRNNSKYTKEQIKKKLKNLYIKNGGRLKVEELKENLSLPSYATILRYFKTTTINDVWNEIENDILANK